MAPKKVSKTSTKTKASTKAKTKAKTSAKASAKGAARKAAAGAPKAAAKVGAGGEAAFLKYQAAASALSAAAVLPFRLDVDLAAHNVSEALAALLPHRRGLEAALPLLPWRDLWALSDLAEGLRFAAVQVDRLADRAKDAEARRGLLAEARLLRAQLLAAADALVASGLIPARPVEKIRAGQGAIDQVKDCIELSALFAKYESAFARNSPIRKEQARRAAAVGSELLRLLKPQSGQKRAPSEAIRAQIDLRDRLATLLTQRFSDLRVAGYYQFREALDSHMPTLQSRRGLGKKKTPPPTPEPTPTPV